MTKNAASETRQDTTLQAMQQMRSDTLQSGLKTEQRWSSLLNRLRTTVTTLFNIDLSKP
jgi:hypothetical protein